jgi:hypothetical protein
LIDLIGTHFPQVTLETCENYDSALRSVIDGGANAAALNRHVGRTLCDKAFPGLFLQRKVACLAVPLAIATRAGDPLNLLQRLNAHIPDEWSSLRPCPHGEN